MEKITSRKKLLLYGCSGMGVNMLNIIMGSYLCSALLVGGFESHIESWTYLSKDLVVAGLWAVFVFLAKALDGIIDLPFATLADKIKSKFGRRKTAILVGFIPMVVTYLLFLIPIDNSATIFNTIWFGFLLCMFYAFYTLTMLTYYATFSEVCKDEADTLFLSNTKSILDVVYFSLGFALLPLFINLGINIRIVALIFLPLSLTMMIPMFLLKEKPNDETTQVRSLTLGKSLKVSFKNKDYIFWLFTTSILTIGTQLFLGGINEVFSTTNLNMTFVMASSFAPVPFTLILYNKIVKKQGVATGLRYALIIFSVGMLILFLCCMLNGVIDELTMTIIAIIGGISISFAIGAFFSITYVVPTNLAKREFDQKGNDVATMYFAVQGLFEGIAAGIATGFILVTLKKYDIIQWLPIVAIVACSITFVLSFILPKNVREIGKVKPAQEVNQAE